ncbi:MAG TPA: hypothetical protein VMU99_03260 [Acidimicrobiales bacterium]|nr:hypothetical protein [Acidimicrobiales bacterium]
MILFQPSRVQKSDFAPSAERALETTRRGFIGSKWAIYGAAIVLSGIVGSTFAARSAAHGAVSNSRMAFAASSKEISSTLQLAIQHERDLIVSAGGFTAGAPNASNSQFTRWANSVQARARYPELLGIGHSVIVPASQLASFAARSLANPAGPLGPGGTFQVSPPGSRAVYCFAESDFARSIQTKFPAGFDF